jgi:2'-5' RNA ligase
MTTRAIVIFPHFENGKFIDEIRAQYDPLYDFIPPHLTLVFPFESNFTRDALIDHVSSQLKDTRPFELVVKGVTGAADGYVFLDVKRGNDCVIDLHDRLYTGILKAYHNRYIPYQPHITIGRLTDPEGQKKVVEDLCDFDIEFRTLIDTITMEIIDDTDRSILEYQYKLQD